MDLLTTYLSQFEARYLPSKDDEYIGRDWLSREVSEFVENSNKSYLLLVGNPGWGKTAFVVNESNWLENHKNYLVIRHYLQRGCRCWTYPNVLLSSLIMQIKTKLGINYDIKLMDRDISLELYNLLIEANKCISDEKRLIIFIDGLDEAFGPLGDNPAEALPEIFKMRLPEKIKCIITSRRGQHLNMLSDVKIYDILDLNSRIDENKEDIYNYVEAKLHNLHGGSYYIEEFITSLVLQCEQDLRYLSTVLCSYLKEDEFEELLLGNFNLPNELKCTFYKEWDKLKISAKERNIKEEELLFAYGLVAIGYETLSWSQWQKLIEYGFNGVMRNKEKWLWLPDIDLLKRVYNKGASMLRLGECYFTNDIAWDIYKYYHNTMIDFIKNELVKHGMYSILHRFLGLACEIGSENMDDYCLKWCVRHYLDGDDINSGCNIATDLRYIAKRVNSGNLLSLISDYEYILTNKELLNVCEKSRINTYKIWLRHRWHGLIKYNRNNCFVIQDALNYACDGCLREDAEKLANYLIKTKKETLIIDMYPPKLDLNPVFISMYENDCEVESVSISYHGRLLVFGDIGNYDNGAVWLWNNITGEVKCLGIHDGPVLSVAINGYNWFAISGGADGKIRYWNIDNGRSFILGNHEGMVLSVSISSYGEYAVSGGSDRMVRLFNIKGGNSKILGEHDNYVLSVSLSADGRYAISGGKDKTVKLWDIEKGKGMILGKHTDWVLSVSLNEDGKYAISIGRDGTIRFWDIEKGISKICEKYNGMLSCGSLNADGKYAVIGCKDGTVYLWDIEKGIKKILGKHDGMVLSVSISSDGKYAASCGSDKTVRLWDIDESNNRVINADVGNIWSADLSHFGRYAVVARCDFDGGILLWNIETNDFIVLGKDIGLISSVSLSANSEYAISGDQDGNVYFWDIKKGSNKVLGKHDGRVLGVSLNANGKCAASGGDDMLVKYWDIEKGVDKVLGNHSGEIYSVSISANGSYIISGGADTTVRIWDLQTGKRRILGEHDSIVESVHINADGRFAVSSGGWERTIRFWDIEKKMNRSIGEHDGGVSCVSLSPDGKYAISGGNDRTVRFWDIEKNECRAIWKGDSTIRSISSLGFLNGVPIIVVVDSRGSMHFLKLMNVMNEQEIENNIKILSKFV